MKLPASRRHPHTIPSTLLDISVGGSVVHVDFWLYVTDHAQELFNHTLHTLVVVPIQFLNLPQCLFFNLKGDVTLRAHYLRNKRWSHHAILHVKICCFINLNLFIDDWSMVHTLSILFPAFFPKGQTRSPRPWMWRMDFPDMKMARQVIFRF